MVMDPKQLSWKELMDLVKAEPFKPEIINAILTGIETLAKRPGVTHIVVFENINLDASQGGRKTAVVVGPSCTYKSLDDVRDKHLGSAPSDHQYPVYYWAKESEPCSLSAAGASA